MEAEEERRGMVAAVSTGLVLRRLRRRGVCLDIIRSQRQDVRRQEVKSHVAPTPPTQVLPAVHLVEQVQLHLRVLLGREVPRHRLR